jgi:DNA-binding HxlR family transcriptional regulator
MSTKDNSNLFCSGNKCPCQEKCPLSSALEIIGGKWKIPIICSLYSDGPTRYNGLKRKIKGITNTMLASSLKELESDGIVLRTQYNEMPLRVEYELTKDSESLIPILRSLSSWGNSWKID